MNFKGRWMAGELPAECIADCSAAGDVSEAVAFWRKRLAFDPPREYAIEYLGGFGAWEDLDTADAETLAERVLWLFACNASEGETTFYLGE